MSDAAIIAELQQQLAFQDQTIDSLNASVSQQQLQIARIERGIKLLAEQIKNLRQDNSQGLDAFSDEKPPHY